MNRLFDLQDKIEAASATGDHLSVIEAMRDVYPLQHISYLGVSIPRLSEEIPFTVNTYSDKWVSHYLDCGYLRIDPVISEGLQSVLPLDWQDLRRRHPRSLPFFEDAQQHNIGNMGLTIPIRGASGEFVLFSISVEDSLNSWSKLKREILPELNMLSFGFHEMVMKHSGLIQPLPKLSPREIEVLKWLASGKSQHDISDILGVSFHTVKHYVETARHRLGALNSSHAVAKAVSRGLIPPPL